MTFFSGLHTKALRIDFASRLLIEERLLTEVVYIPEERRSATVLTNLGFSYGFPDPPESPGYGKDKFTITDPRE